MRLSGKVAIVTGGASGIGQATAILFAREGAKVVVADLKEVQGQETVRQITAAGGEAIFVRTDVRLDADVRDLVATAVQRFGKLDVLYNNAGIAVEGTVVETSPEDWERVLDVNLASIYRGCHFAIPEMIALAAARSSTPPPSRGCAASRTTPPTPPPRAG